MINNGALTKMLKAWFPDSNEEELEVLRGLFVDAITAIDGNKKE